jgi:hypothetical protein
MRRPLKKSTAISLTLLDGVIAAALTACPGHADVVGVDPCYRATFNAPACQLAIAERGYHYDGGWYPVFYGNPYAYYYHTYDVYRLGGGRVFAAPMVSYSPAYRSPDARANAFVNRATYGGRTSLSTGTMSAFAAGRSGATMHRGGFGSIGATRGGFGGG